ncbi:STAS domain-containing protein [Microbacterium sp. ABRD28]|uniref:STAS domain-containing protein n=1 Tax=Microbacterium sp. ABRD28 TaxID=2268461 RepID=UPI000F55622A|nr:STAS domain-containing protein [Microbacterium sp. ABRD28]AZC14443.1 anti-sigma factor antagonist [Microbacterium sp. ABRD28]
MSLSHEIRRRDDVVEIVLSGRIDRDAAAALEEAGIAASEGPPASMLLDFSGVDYINSTGIALIVALLARARAQRIAVRATGLTEHYRHIFDITRLSDFIEIVQPTPS